jgi:hypothetical protein
MKGGKRGIPVCSQCARSAFDERIWITHERLDGETTEKDLVFCSKCCFEEYFERLFLPKVEAGIREENNRLAKLICPACKRRVQRNG